MISTIAIYSILAYYATTSTPFDVMVRIAKCESSMNPVAKNPNGSAKGIFQFIDKTWLNYCEGDVLNPVDNTKCFVKLYPTKKSWWQCQ